MTNEKEIFILEGSNVAFDEDVLETESTGKIYGGPITSPGDYDGDAIDMSKVVDESATFFGIPMDLGIGGDYTGIASINYGPSSRKTMFAYPSYRRLVYPIHPIIKKDDRKLKSLFNEEKMRWDKCLYQSFPIHYVVTFKNSRMEILRDMGLSMASCDPLMDHYLTANHMLNKRMPRYTLLDSMQPTMAWMSGGMFDRLSERYNKLDMEMTNKIFKTFTPIVIDSMEVSKPKKFNRSGRAYPTKGRK